MFPNDKRSELVEQIAQLVSDGYTSDSKVTISCNGKEMEVYGYEFLSLNRLMAELELEVVSGWEHASEPIPPFRPPSSSGIGGDIERVIMDYLARDTSLNHAMSTWPLKESDRNNFIQMIAAQIVCRLHERGLPACCTKGGRT